MIRAALPVLLALSFALAATYREGPRDERWHTDLELATRIAAETGKPMLVVFR